MKFVDQSVELIKNDGSCLKLKINTSYAVYVQIVTYIKNVKILNNIYASRSKYEDILNFDCNTHDGIIDAYKYGFSLSHIKERCKFSSATIFKYIKSAGFEIRHRVYNMDVDHDYFRNIDRPEKAYLLGLIQTDGCISDDQQNKIDITQKKSVSWYVKTIMSNICKDVKSYKNSSCNKVGFSDKDLVDNLKSIGIIKNKTYNQTDEDVDRLWNYIPSEYLQDFIRGLIDGDGWISFFVQSRGVNESSEFGFCARNEHIVDLLNNWIFEKVGYTCKKYISNGVWYTRIRDYKTVIKIGKILFEHFEYPCSHPEKAIKYIKRLNESYNIGSFGDELFTISTPVYLDLNDPENVYNFLHKISDIEIK